MSEGPPLAEADQPQPQTGVWLFTDAPAAELVAAVVALDEAGIDEVWLADEGVAREPVPLLAAAAARTRRIRLGVGITTPALRHPGALASTIATLDELSEGRAVLGLGVGGELTLAPFGLRVERPVPAITDAIATARAVLACQPGPGYRPPAHAAPARAVPIFVGARGERLNRLASAHADGVFLSGFPLADLAQPVAWARSIRPVRVALYPSVRFAPGAADDPTALRGSPDEVAAGLSALVAAHAPDSIGLALIDGAGPVAMAAQAVRAFTALAGTR